MNRYSSILKPDSAAGARREAAGEKGPTDNVLFARFLGGDDTAFVELFQRHATRLFVYALKIVGDRQAAHDLMQDVWERIIRFRSEGKEAPHSPLGLLIRMTRNICLNHVQRRREHVPLDDVPEWRQPVTSGRDMTELEEAVVIALERLPIEQREVLILHAYSGYKFDEIAEMFDEQESTIRTRAWRARTRLGRIIAALIGLDETSDETKKNASQGDLP